MTARQLAVLLATAFAILTPAAQAIWDIGLSAAEFSQSGNTTLRAAGYAFSIWSLIYLGLAAYATWQALPRNREDVRLAQLAWPSVVAITGCGLWIWASAADARWLTVAIIVVSAATLVAALVRTAPQRQGGLSEALLVFWPLGLLAGWLTIASAINILTVLTAEGLIAPSGATTWAVAGVLAVVAVCLGALWASRLAIYAVPIAWGLAAVFVAERQDQPGVAALAAAMAALLALAALWTAWRSARRRPASA